MTTEDLRVLAVAADLPAPEYVVPAEALASLRKLEIEPDGYVLPAYTAVAIAAAAVSQAKTAGKNPFDILTAYDFQTPLGAVRFDAKGDLSDSPYRLFRYDGSKFVEVE